jgi:hypothetical protein
MAGFVPFCSVPSLKRTADEAERASKAHHWPHAAALWEHLCKAQPEEPLYWAKLGEACLEISKALEAAQKAAYTRCKGSGGLTALFGRAPPT